MERTMKNLILLFAVLITAGVTSCDEDTDIPIHLMDDEEMYWAEDNILHFAPYSTEKTYTIYGGDGNYTVDCAIKDIVEVMHTDEKLTIKPKKVGNTTVTIKDNSNHSFNLAVEVKYYEASYNVVEVTSIIKGDLLTIKEEKELKEKVKATIDMKVGGTYKFTYTNPGYKEGNVWINHNTTGFENIVGTFQITKETFKEYPIDLFTLKIDGKETQLYFAERSFVNVLGRALPPRVYIMIEDVTAKYKTEYPAVEEVYVVQTIRYLND